MRKRFFAGLLSLVIIAGLLPVPAMAAVSAPSQTNQYILDTDGLDVGAVYAIYTNVAPDSANRILYHTGKGYTDTDKVGGSVNGNQLTLNNSFAENRQLWRLVRSGSNYAFQNLDSGRYLNLNQQNGKNIQTASWAQPLTIEAVGSGVYYLRGTSGGLSFCYRSTDANFFCSRTTGAAQLRLYKQTSSISNGVAPSGTVTGGQPFVTGPAATNSDNFRIPSLITLSNDWIMAASDIRWRTAGDSPQNLDTIVSVSKDGGNTWDWKVINYFDDMVDAAQGLNSASFIDPSLVQTADGTIHMLVGDCPSRVGLVPGNVMGSESTGFDASGRMIVAWADNIGQDTPTNIGAYQHYVDINNPAAGQQKQVNGNTITLWPIRATSGNTETKYYVDAFLDVYYDYQGNRGVEPVYCAQLSGSAANPNKNVQSNLFYRNSHWKAYPVFYIMHRTATITESGEIKWSDPQFLNIKYTNNERFTGVCPGRGTVVSYNGKERILFPLYDNATGTEYASAIYSDDGGKTWKRSGRADKVGTTGKSSESQIVVLPNGDLRMYSRNTINYLGYSDSTDGGQTWSSYTVDYNLLSNNPLGNGCMMSFINLDGVLTDPEGKNYDNLILASYPVVQRTQGVVRIGTIDESNNEVKWLNDDTPRFTGGTFAYSCLTQLPELDTFGLLYEYGASTNTIEYTKLTVEDLLGPGWTLESGTYEIEEHQGR